MSLAESSDVMHQYFAAMGRGEDFSVSFTEDVTWLMVDSGQEVRGASAVRDYILELHDKMVSQQGGELAVSDNHAYLEGLSVHTQEVGGPTYSYCLVYDLEGARISAMRCYGTLAALMAAPS